MRKDFIGVFLFFLLLACYSSFTLAVNVVDNVTPNESTEGVVVTRVDALMAISDANDSIQRMLNNGFPVHYVSDQLAEAQIVVSQMYYVDILNSVDVSYDLKAEAYNELRLVNYKEISYEDVFVYIDNIERARGEAFEISDLLSILKIEIDGIESDGVNVDEIWLLYESAYSSFEAERYSETRATIDDIYFAIEESVAERATSAILLRNVGGFLAQYWPYVLVFLFFIFLFCFFVVKRIRVFLINKKIKYLTFEKKALENLVIQTQKDRYKKKNISEMVYNIRYQKYMDKIDEINQAIPVLKSRVTGSKRK